MAADQHRFERVRRIVGVVLAEEARDREGLDEAPNVDRLEAVEDEDADAQRLRRIRRSRHRTSFVSGART
jgi:hypothetical protein